MPKLTPDVVRNIHELLHDDQILMAIKVYREATGVSLAEAKAAVERISQDESAEPPNDVRGRDNPVLDARIKSLLAKKKKIDAIKIYRAEYRVGLKEAKDAVESMEASLSRDPAATGSSYEPTIGNDPFAGEDGRPRWSIVLTIVVLVALCGLAAWFLMTNM